MQNVPLITGSIVKIWHNNRGHDYIVVAAENNSDRVGVIRASCINNDGTIHRTKLRSMVQKANNGQSIFDSIIDLSRLGSKPGSINRVCGVRNIGVGVVNQLLTTFELTAQWSFINRSTNIYPPLSALDARIATQY